MRESKYSHSLEVSQVHERISNKRIFKDTEIAFVRTKLLDNIFFESTISEIIKTVY